MLWLRGVPAHQAVLPECPDVPDLERRDSSASQGCRPGPSYRPLPPAVRLSMTRNARAW